MTNDAGNAEFAVPKRRKRAAALRYDYDQDPVPRLVAKGAGDLADRIIELARAHNIPVREDPDLINLLCKLEVDQLIPQKLFRAVAEVMAYVYRLNTHVQREKPTWLESLARAKKR
jgi:flagellar biosynthesis protein